MFNENNTQHEVILLKAAFDVLIAALTSKEFSQAQKRQAFDDYCQECFPFQDMSGAEALFDAFNHWVNLPEKYRAIHPLGLEDPGTFVMIEMDQKSGKEIELIVLNIGLRRAMSDQLSYAQLTAQGLTNMPFSIAFPLTLNEVDFTKDIKPQQEKNNNASHRNIIAPEKIEFDILNVPQNRSKEDWEINSIEFDPTQTTAMTLIASAKTYITAEKTPVYDGPLFVELAYTVFVNALKDITYDGVKITLHSNGEKKLNFVDTEVNYLFRFAEMLTDNALLAPFHLPILSNIKNKNEKIISTKMLTTFLSRLKNNPDVLIENFDAYANALRPSNVENNDGIYFEGGVEKTQAIETHLNATMTDDTENNSANSDWPSQSFSDSNSLNSLNNGFGLFVFDDMSVMGGTRSAEVSPQKPSPLKSPLSESSSHHSDNKKRKSLAHSPVNLFNTKKRKKCDTDISISNQTQQTYLKRENHFRFILNQFIEKNESISLLDLLHALSDVFLNHCQQYQALCAQVQRERAPSEYAFSKNTIRYFDRSLSIEKENPYYHFIGKPQKQPLAPFTYDLLNTHLPKIKVALAKNDVDKIKAEMQLILSNMPNTFLDDTSKKQFVLKELMGLAIVLELCEKNRNNPPFILPASLQDIQSTLPLLHYCVSELQKGLGIKVTHFAIPENKERLPVCRKLFDDTTLPKEAPPKFSSITLSFFNTPDNQHHQLNDAETETQNKQQP